MQFAEQVLNMTRSELDWVTEHLGHSVNVHREHYHSPSIEVAKILLMQDKAQTHTCVWKQLKYIQFPGISSFRWWPSKFNKGQLPNNVRHCGAVVLNIVSLIVTPQYFHNTYTPTTLQCTIFYKLHPRVFIFQPHIIFNLSPQNVMDNYHTMYHL